MKKIITILLLCLCGCANAQVRLISNISQNVDNATSYINFNSIQSKVKSIQLTVSKISGTLAGAVYLEGTVDGFAWVGIDSMPLTDTTIATKVIVLNGTYFNSYRARFVTTGTQVSNLTMAVLRRPDE
ncbi:MAG: hypothetical protein EKK39_14890 [Sphingobacteriales bacterium]|nr:MAG: hypothetical protein EKK39_14890 [Sphingobacteriales bacterium]